MKTKLLYLVVALGSFQLIAQNVGWHQYAKPLYVNQMVKDASGNYHYATNLGYQKLDSNFNTVEVKNLTSQDTPLGNCFAVAVNPSNENQIALAENERLFIYTNGVETNQFQITPSTPFTGPGLYFNNNNELYVFDKHVSTEGYSIFENGTLTDVVTAGIRPQDIVENNGGTKIFIAGTNNGLWEYTKATDTWVNYTMGNSTLISNFINDLYVDINDNLYAGSYQGINKLEPGGTMTACMPPSFYPVFELDIHPTSGDILARTSQPNSSNTFGFCIVDFDSCTWTNYTDTNTCFTTNMFETVQFATMPESGKVVASGAILSAENTYVFDPASPTNSCTSIDFNYLGTPVRVDVNYIVDLEVRKKTDGTVDVGFTSGNGFDKFHYFPINPLSFNGTFPSATEVTLPVGKPAYSIIKDNGYFIIENNEGWVFVDENDNTTEFNHNILDYLSIVTKKAAKFDSDDGTITLIHKGFDASFNYRIFKTTYNTGTGTGNASEEIFTNDRDLTQNIIFGTSEDKTSGNVAVVAVKTNSSGEIARTAIHAEPNMPAVNNWDRIHAAFPKFDPTIFSFVLDDLFSMFVPDFDTYKIIHEDNDDNSVTEEDTNINSGGSNDKIIGTHSTEISVDESGGIGNAFVTMFAYFSVGSYRQNMHITTVEPSSNEGLRRNFVTEIIDAELINLPKDIFVKEFNLVQYSTTEAMIVLLTNYGILIKNAIDISNITLSANDVSINKDQLYLYPNPAKNSVSFSDKTINKIEVFDMSGKLIKSANTYSITVKGLGAGLYLVKGINDDDRSIIKKLIKN